MNRFTEDDVFDDDDYHESEDEDYNPDNEQNNQSSDEDHTSDEEERKLSANYKHIQGDGGLIKTRAQREKGDQAPSENKLPSVVGETSVDVDALWAEMTSTNPKKDSQKTESTSTKTESKSTEDSSKAAPAVTAKTTESKIQNNEDDTIVITRKFKFAGEVKTETKVVPRLSSEGQDYLKEQQRLKEEEKLRKLGGRREPVKRKMSLMEEYKMNKAKKINTLEKSRLDWLGFVDKEGIRDDLTKHNKDGYIDRQNFLERVDQNRDHEIRQQRAKKLQ